MLRSNNRTLLLIIAVLLLINGVMIYLITRPVKQKEPDIPRSERMIRMVQDELDLDSAQVKNYIELRKYRDSVMKPVQNDLWAAKLEMFRQVLKDSLAPGELEAAAAKVGEKQARMELEYFNHFKRMQNMLEPSQLPKFDSLLIRMVYRSTGAADSVQRQETGPKTGN